MNKVCLLILLVACLCMFAEGQLTFTSSWGGGKRSGMNNMACRNDEAIAAIYKMIQNWTKLKWDHTGRFSFLIKKESSKSIYPVKSYENEAERFIMCQTQKP